MRIGVPKESFPGERRVAVIPDSAAAMIKAGHEVSIEPGAGAAAGFPDQQYRDKGATVAADRAEVFAQAELLFQIRAAGANPTEGKADLALFKKDQALAATLDPLGSPEQITDLAAKGVTAFSLELMPRITRAQSMDVLSSMATVAGYKAVLVAAESSPRMFPMFMTAAGTVTPAHVLIIGAGVAGLQAIATAKRLGAVVKAYDVRAAVKEQIESLGAKFVEMELEAEGAEDKGGYAKEMGEAFLSKQRELMMSVCKESHVVITTAAIPGKKSPVLVTKEMVEAMMPGSVIVDLAAERGGNCELTQADQVVVEHDVTIHGPTNLPSTVPFHASQMFSKNVLTFLKEISVDGKLKVDMENEVHSGTLVTRGGDVIHERVKAMLSAKTGAG